MLGGCSGPRAGGRQLTLALAVFPEEAAHYRRFLAEFEKSQNVRVNIVAQSYIDILRALGAEAGAGRGALDIVELDLAMLGEGRGFVREVGPLITGQARALFPKAAWDAAGQNGHIYFVPHRLMWQAMIYNRREVPYPPATWAELEAFARKYPGKLALKAARYEGAICDVMPFVWAAGGSELRPDSRGSIHALTFLGEVAPDLNPQSAVFREMSILEAQARGSVWIHFNWPFAMSYLAGKGLAPSVDLSAPLPAGPDGAVAVLGGGYLGIPRSAPHPKLAAAFLEYLLTPEAQHRLGRDLGWYGSVPPPPGSEQALLYAGFEAMRSRVRARPVLAGYFRLSDKWQRAIRGVLFGGQSARAALSEVSVAGIADGTAGTGRLRFGGRQRASQ